MSEQSVADRNDLRQLKEKDFCCRTIHTPQPSRWPCRGHSRSSSGVFTGDPWPGAEKGDASPALF